MATTNKYLSAHANSTNPVPSISSAVAHLSFFSALISMLLIVILHFVKSELTPAGHMLSEYAIGQYGWIMKLAFFAWAASCMSLVFSIRTQIGSVGGKAGLVLLFIASMALIAGGIFVIDSPYAEKQELTMHGNLHGLSAMIGLPGQAIATLLISYSLKRNLNWSSVMKPIIRFAHFTWISLGLMFASTFIMMSKSQGKFSSDTAIGWFNRLLVLIYCTWLIIVASKAIQLHRNAVEKYPE